MAMKQGVGGRSIKPSDLSRGVKQLTKAQAGQGNQGSPTMGVGGSSRKLGKQGGVGAGTKIKGKNKRSFSNQAVRSAITNVKKTPHTNSGGKISVGSDPTRFRKGAI